MINVEFDFFTSRDGTSTIRESVGMGGGGIGAVSSFNINITRYSPVTDLTDFFNEFYPATSGIVMVGAEVNIGFCWAGATTESQITYAPKRLYVEDYYYTPTNITLYCVERRELEMTDLPYYKIQKDKDNKVSYFPYAPNENYGLPIPIVYGSLNVFDYAINSFALSPCLLVKKSNSTFIIASHACKTTSYEYYQAGHYSLFKSVGGLESYLILYNQDGTTSSTNTITHTITFQATPGQVLGMIDIPLQEISRYNDATGVDNVFAGDEVAYAEIAGGGTKKLALRVAKNGTTGDIGSLTAGTGASSSGLAIEFRIASNDAGSRSYTVNYRNYAPDPPANGTGNTQTFSGGTTIGTASYNFNNATTSKNSTTLPWTLEEIVSLDYYILNNDADVADKIRVYRAYIHIIAIIVIAIDEKRYTARTVRNA